MKLKAETLQLYYTYCTAVAPIGGMPPPHPSGGGPSAYHPVGVGPRPADRPLVSASGRRAFCRGEGGWENALPRPADCRARYSRWLAGQRHVSPPTTVAVHDVTPCQQSNSVNSTLRTQHESYIPYVVVVLTPAPAWATVLHTRQYRDTFHTLGARGAWLAGRDLGE